MLLAALGSVLASAYYVPGIDPIGYDHGDTIRISVNGIHSHQAVVPFGYYTLPFCRPTSVSQQAESLGQVLWGDKIETSSYVFNMAVDQRCQRVDCSTVETEMDADKLKRFEKFIEDNYRGYLVFDNLPVFNNGSFVYGNKCQPAITKVDKNFMPYDFLRGYAIGVKRACHGEKTLINNHLDFRIQYNRDEASDAEKPYRVVGFTATPYSIDHEFAENNDVPSCNSGFNLDAATRKPLTTDPASTKRIAWTYSVTWIEEPSIAWGSRWDTYLHTSIADTNDKVHWFSIFNSLIVVVCLFSVISVVLLRALRRDFARYNAVLATLEQGDTAKEEAGWKMVFRDVFRPPASINALITCVASGTQVICVAMATLVVSCFGVLSPANRGNLLGSLIFLYIASAFVAGLMCARLLKQFSSKSWLTVFETAIIFPGVIIGVFMVANVMLRSVKASSAVSFASGAILTGMWLVVSVPLALVGASIGFSADPWSNPNGIVSSVEPRPLPANLPWWLSDGVCFLLPALIPLGTAFLELRFILASLWQGIVYYVFGFLSVVFFLSILAAALTSVVVVYYRLCAEHYDWWWVSFAAPGGFGLPLLGYFLYYLATQLTIRTGVAMTLYVLYMTLIAVAYGLLMGAVGFLASYLFIRKIYTSIKLE